MEGEQKKPPSSLCLSEMTDMSKEAVVNFSVDEGIPSCTEAGGIDASYTGTPKSPTGSSLKSGWSRDPPPKFCLVEKPDRTEVSAANQPACWDQSKPRGCDLRLPPLIEDWTREHVKDWLIFRLRISDEIAQTLYDQQLSGGCLASFEKQDLLELGVPAAPAIQIMKQVDKIRKHSESFEVSKQTPSSHFELSKDNRWKIPESSGNMEEVLNSETVSTDSGCHSQSSAVQMSAVQMLQMARDRIRAVIDMETTTETQSNIKSADSATAQRSICKIRAFDERDSTTDYREDRFLPPVAGSSNLLHPVHEYQLLPSANEASEKEILYEFTKEVFSFAASCMNSRTNGTIHFGVNNQPEPQHGQVIGHKITSFTAYQEAFELSFNQYFEGQQVNTARMCIRPPNFIQVYCQDGTTSDKWVIEVDVVPTYAETQENLFYTTLSIASAANQQLQTECLFIRDGLRSINILADPNPRVVQENMKRLTDKLKHWVSARKVADNKAGKRLPQGYQGQRLKQLITRGRDAFENTLQVIVVTDKCHPGQLEHLDFVKEMKLFAVLEFDPESDRNGTCNFYRGDRVANLHYPHMYSTQDSLTAIIGKMNLFKQTSWIFCNGRTDEENEEDKPLIPSEWLKKRSGEISNMVSLLCSPELLSRDRLLVIFILHAAVTDISSPFVETFCAIHRTLEGTDNMLCICKDFTVFSHWQRVIEDRCKEDITNKCIYELSLHEISSTIKTLKVPQTQSSQRFLPSTGSSSVMLAKKDEELFTVLDILCENECENTEIEKNDSFEEFRKKTEEDFYRGGQVTWWNFYISEKKGSLPFIKRGSYHELHDLVRVVDDHTSPCAMINLFHHPGCGGTTLAMNVLWDLRRKFRCAVVKNNRATNEEIAAQVMNLLTHGNQEKPGSVPVLLLADNLDDVEDLRQHIITSNRQRHNGLIVMILSTERTQFPDESSRNSRFPNVFMINKLSTREQSLFNAKLQELSKDHEKPETFYAFMIMTNNFSEDYIKNLVSNIVKNLDSTTQQGKLLSFLALLNSYVNGSYMSLTLCEELVGIRNVLWKSKTLDDVMNPFSTLLITFTVEEHGTYQAVRFLHQTIASHSLQILSQKHKLSLSEVTINLLFCDKVYRSCMGKDFLLQNIQSILVTRQRKEEGNEKDTLFSPLIEAINKNEGSDQIKEVLERATVRFDKSATLPQALARHFCLNQKDYTSALKWALDAQKKLSNSYISDTVGQVYKSHLKHVIKDSEELTPETLEECLTLACKAVKAFKDSQELGKRDGTLDIAELSHKKRYKSYNTSGYVGEIEVTMILLELITQRLISGVSDKYKRDQILRFLNGLTTLNTFIEHRNPNMNELVAVLQEHEKFLVSLKPRLKEIFIFFENYFTYFRPRYVPLEKNTIDTRSKQKVSMYFKKYIGVFSSSDEDKASEKAKHPNLSVAQQLLDHRDYLELKRADSFAGLLQYLNDKNKMEMKHIFEKWEFIFKNSPRCTPDTVNFILANIVLHHHKPSSKSLTKYEELVKLLNEELQNHGTHSNLTELYYLSMLLMWPTKDQRLTLIPPCNNFSTYVTAVKKSFYRRFSHMFPARSAIAHFYLGKSTGLKRIIPKVKLDDILVHASRQDSSTGHSHNLHHLWQSGAAWKEQEVQNQLLRVKGQSENGDIYVNYSGNLRMSIRPAYLGDIRSGSSREVVSFYLGFTMEGPVAYNVRYEKDK